jgi:hypothetical protein
MSAPSNGNGDAEFNRASKSGDRFFEDLCKRLIRNEKAMPRKVSIPAAMKLSFRSAPKARTRNPEQDGKTSICGPWIPDRACARPE